MSPMSLIVHIVNANYIRKSQRSAFGTLTRNYRYMSTGIAAAVGTAFGVFYYLRQKKRDVPSSNDRNHEACHEVEHPPNSWVEALWFFKEVVRYMYQETLARWGTVDLFVGLAYLSNRDDSRMAVEELSNHGHLVNVTRGSPEFSNLHEELLILHRYMLYCRGQKPFKTHLQLKFWKEHLGIERSHIVLHQPASGLLRPAYVLVADPVLACVVLCIRGTRSMKDLFTSLTGTSRPHHSITPNGVVLGHAHTGMLAAARWLLNTLLPALHTAMEEHPSFQMRIVGHSLGGGVAALLTMMVRERAEHPALKDVRCVALACPCCLTANLSDACKSYVTSIVHGSDIVPTFSATSVDTLREEVVRSSWFSEFKSDLRSRAARAVRGGFTGMSQATTWTTRSLIRSAYFPFRTCANTRCTPALLPPTNPLLPDHTTPSILSAEPSYYPPPTHEVMVRAPSTSAPHIKEGLKDSLREPLLPLEDEDNTQETEAYMGEHIAVSPSAPFELKDAGCAEDGSSLDDTPFLRSRIVADSSTPSVPEPSPAASTAAWSWRAAANFMYSNRTSQISTPQTDCTLSSQTGTSEAQAAPSAKRTWASARSTWLTAPSQLLSRWRNTSQSTGTTPGASLPTGTGPSSGTETMPMLKSSFSMTPSVMARGANNLLIRGLFNACITPRRLETSNSASQPLAADPETTLPVEADDIEPSSLSEIAADQELSGEGVDGAYPSSLNLQEGMTAVVAAVTDERSSFEQNPELVPDDMLVAEEEAEEAELAAEVAAGSIPVASAPELPQVGQKLRPKLYPAGRILHFILQDQSMPAGDDDDEGSDDGDGTAVSEPFPDSQDDEKLRADISEALSTGLPSSEELEALGEEARQQEAQVAALTVAMASASNALGAAASAALKGATARASGLRYSLFEVTDLRLYGRVRLCRNMMLDHLIPRYLEAVTDFICQLEEANAEAAH